MKTIAFFTTARAEFGILSALIRQVDKDSQLDYKLFAGGMHLAPRFGRTIQEIQEQGFNISAQFDFLQNEDKPYYLAKSVGIAIQKVAGIFKDYDFDMVCILGDRFELLSIVTCAILFNKPIIHLHGGEITKGAIDEQVRHMITKAAHLHFVSCDQYAENIRRMAEPAWRIFNTGALAVDNMTGIEKISKKDLFKELQLKIDLPTILMTYHPVTLEQNISVNKQMDNIFKTLARYNFQLVITAPNMDSGRETIINKIKDEIKKNKDYHYYKSLGMKRYFNLMPHCEFVIGNSSSAILETPFYKIPTINIGDRQTGRIRHQSVIDTNYTVHEIDQAISTALSANFRAGLKNMRYKFGKGNAAQKMIDIIKSTKIDDKLMIKSSDLLEQ